MFLYELVTREALPFPGEPKPVFLLRRDLKRSALRAFKKTLPGLWSRFDARETNQRLAHWHQTWGKPGPDGELTSIAKEMLICTLLEVDAGRSRLADAMLKPIQVKKVSKIPAK
jgi:hypothetical protein